MNRKTSLLLLAALALLLLAGCAASPNAAANTPSADGTTAGFWLGFWHGLILPIAFLVSLFKSSVGVYELHNNGGWYNAGYVLGAGFLPVLQRASANARRARRPRDPAKKG